jgi:hypothetical protein
MPSGQVIVNNALVALGILGQGEVANASDSADALTELNSMWDAWSIDEGLIYAELPVDKALTANVGSYTVGTGATFNTPRPNRIYQAFIVSGANRNELEIVARLRNGDLVAFFRRVDQIDRAAAPARLALHRNAITIPLFRVVAKRIFADLAIGDAQRQMRARRKGRELPAIRPAKFEKLDIGGDGAFLGDAQRLRQGFGRHRSSPGAAPNWPTYLEG